MSKTPERKAYQQAKYRCENPKANCYENYGGRGIRFLFKSFEEFFVELGHRPTSEHSLERVNNDLGYQPGNCTWATMAEQHQNKRHGNQYMDTPPTTYEFESEELKFL